MADNCLSMDWWSYPPSLPDKLWTSEAFARDGDDVLITRALQASLSNSNSNHFQHESETINNNSDNNNNNFVVESRRIRNMNRMSTSVSVSGKISKRKSRASKKSATTYITADPANFRQMVQQVTGGVRFGGGGGDCGFPVEPEPHVRRDGMVLPTLDTSSAVLLQETFSFNPTAAPMGSGGGYVSTAPVGLGSGSAFDAYSGFPTLESWGAM